MAEPWTTRLKHAWSAFSQKDNFKNIGTGLGAAYGYRPDRTRLTGSNERSIISAVYTRLSIDVAATNIRHVKMGDNDQFVETINSGLNDCLNVEANIDQAGRHFRQDIALTLFDKGVIAIVPVETDMDPLKTGGYDIKSLRVGEITSWYPEHVRVRLYNQRTGLREEVILPKQMVAIVENPLYNVMNEPNSTLQRLIRKLNLLDVVDEQSSSGKLDLIIQLPYVIKSEQRRQQAEQRRKDIEVQLKGSQYGIAYTDGTERITQLNRPSENNLLNQVKYLTDMLYSQLGLTQSIFEGTADEATMINYYNRTIDPIMAAITEAMKRTFLTKTARTQRQSIQYFRDPFKLVPMSQLAELSDKLTRNEILTSNEFRGIIGYMPKDDPKADQLVNSNLPQGYGSVPNVPDPNVQPVMDYSQSDQTMNDIFDQLDKAINEAIPSGGA